MLPFILVSLLSYVQKAQGQQSAFEAHPLQPQLPYAMDAFTDVNHGTVLPQDEVEVMYYVEHYQVVKLAEEMAAKANALLQAEQIVEWEPWAKKLRGMQNQQSNWEWFWESLTAEKDENGKPALPEVGSKLYQLIEQSFGDYERMREHYLESVGVASDYFKKGERSENKNNEKTNGWIWVLYDSVNDKLIVKNTDDNKSTYLDGTGNGLLHPILVLDKILACSAEDIHYIINWKKVAERLDEVLNREYVLVTGGLGYIGSHTVVELVQGENEHVIIIDNMNNAKIISMNRVKAITGRPNNFVFHQIDLRDKEQLESVIFKQYKIKSVIHFAALKAVGESISKPLEYYHNNVGSTIQLLMLMRDYGVKTLVFSSSATVYGDNPLSDENAKIQPINPYGQTKAMIEQVMSDYAVSKPDVLMIALRYFNPIGAHESGLIGEDPNDIPNNLMPYIQKVASGHLPFLRVFGNDYDTPDGTGVRDYIHVTDLAKGHTAALKKDDILKGYQVFNLGTGSGTSVFQMKDAFEKASGVEIKFEIHPRRPGDTTQVLAIPDRANQVLEWKTNLTVMEACRDAWRWVKMNPNGYEEKIEESVL